MRNWSAELGGMLWPISCVLASIVISTAPMDDEFRIALASMLSLLLAFAASLHSVQRKREIRQKEQLLDFYSGLSENFSAGLGQEASFLMQANSSELLSRQGRSWIILELAGGMKLERLLEKTAEKGRGLERQLPEVFGHLLLSGMARTSVASEILNLWTENLAISTETDRLLSETSSRAQFLYFLNSFAFGFLASSFSLIRKMANPFDALTRVSSNPLVPLAIFAFQSTIYLLVCKRFSFTRQLEKYAISALIFWGTFLCFQGVLDY